MADYCYDCFKKTFPDINPKDNDLVDLVGIDEAVYCICEGCGAGWFDRYGKRINVKSKTPTKEQNCPVFMKELPEVDPTPTIMLNAVEMRVCGKCGIVRMLSETCPSCGWRGYWIYRFFGKFSREVYIDRAGVRHLNKIEEKKPTAPEAVEVYEQWEGKK